MLILREVKLEFYIDNGSKYFVMQKALGHGFNMVYQHLLFGPIP